MKMHLNLTPVKIQRSRSFGNLGQNHLSVVCQHFQTTSLKLLNQFQLNFIYSLRAKGEKSLFGPDYMTKIAAMPIYGKTLKILFSRTIGPIALKSGTWHFMI